MQDPKWIGTSPSNVFWSEDSKSLYFSWNPDKNKADSLYKITPANHTPQKVSLTERLSLPSQGGSYNHAGTQKVFSKNGDIFYLDIKTGKLRQITYTNDFEGNPVFSQDEQKIIFSQNSNLFSWSIATGELRQVTDFKKGRKLETPKPNDQEKWLKNDQIATLEVIKERKEKKDITDKYNKANQPKRPKEIFTDDKNVGLASLTADEKYVVYTLNRLPAGKTAIVPSYVTESGFTEDIPARVKVGNPVSGNELYVYDIDHDTVFKFSEKDIPGITDLPDYAKDYSKKDTAKAKKPENRKINFFGINYSPDGKLAVIQARSTDNKDLWLLKLDLPNHKLIPIYRLRDEAWVNFGGFSVVDWLQDNQNLALVSEESGYSHLYLINVATEAKKQLTAGKFEVQQANLSKDKQFFYLVSNQVHPGEKHIYKLSVSGGQPVQLSSMTGAHEMYLSPDEKFIAFRYSTTNKPWELYLTENKTGAKSTQITNSITTEFKTYPWREPEVLSFKARDGADVYARLYKPAKPTGAAVVFVHGAGYLQNAHKWWSQYFREYMFHNLLVDKGYTVLDIDYRGSAGYGRDWRTGIYRWMGGKDLSDHVDAAKFLVEKHGIDPKRIGIYGGSYGGFITLMAMFTEPDVFKAGAALRPVTDWAHYNHPYTSNILNEPYTDSLAYRKSSPIYFANGLKGHLLICHGMVDVNVHFQDVVRLSQRLIELKKENWELAVYPVEDHGFVEPTSWMDEYKRILKLFDDNLK